MLSIATFVLCIALTFVYRALNPVLHLDPKLAKRFRVGVGAIIMALSVTVGYLFPVEIGRALNHQQQYQSHLQGEKTERRMASEQRHAARMIEIFGSTEKYLAYLSRQNR